MLELLKKLHETEVELYVNNYVYSYTGMEFYLKKITGSGTYGMTVRVDIEDISKAKDPDAYLTKLLLERIDEFIEKYSKIEAVKVPEIDFFYP